MTATSGNGTDADDPKGQAVDDAEAPAVGPTSRTGRLIGWGKGVAEHGQARTLAARDRSAPIDIGYRLHEHDKAVGGGVLSAATAFRLFLFMVPFVFLLATGFGLSARVADRSPESVAKSSGITGILAQSFSSTKSLTSTTQIVVLLTALYASFQAAASIVKVLNAALGLIWRVPPSKTKTWWAVVVMGVTLLMLALITLLGHLRDAHPASGFLLTLITMAVPFGLWWWVSTKLPHGDAPDWALIPGAVLMAVGVQLLHLASVYYVAPRVSGKSETYGTIGVSLSVLAWCYLLGRLVVLTATVNVALWARTKDRLGEETPGGDIPQIAGRLGVLRGMAQSAKSLLR